ncbi:MAG: cysteine desulfurase [Alphaproteobacteria bacterium]|nr:cysteine desulfurase [Alphaproteobacteria bacterium]
MSIYKKYDIEQIRKDFPILSREINGKPLVFLDSAASAQKPRCVIDAMVKSYEYEYANIHRGAYYLSEKATENYENAREKLRSFMNAEKACEVIFTRNATESINLVTATYGRKFLNKGDEVIITEAEHHSNIVPWQMLRDENEIVLKICPIEDSGDFIIDKFKALLSDKTKFVSVPHVSNVLGTIFPVKEITALAHEAGATVLIDGCQAINHMPVDVQDIDCDFYVISAHKIYGPSGIGALYGKEDILNKMPPYQGGGDMIEEVTFEKTTFAPLPNKFEAGTPAITQAVGFGAAIDYVNSYGIENIAAHEKELLTYTTEKLTNMDGIKIIGTAPNKSSVISFIADFAHAGDLAVLLDKYGVSVRAGHHCAAPLIHRMNQSATARASLAMYNTKKDIDALIEALEKVRKFF